MITFQKITIKNFLSVGQEEMVVVFNKGTTLVASTENGSGKSSIWRDAIFYCLFDKPYKRGLTKGQLINNRSGRACEVSLEFMKGSDHYKVVRGQKPAVFYIEENGIGLSSEAIDFQKTLISILGMSEKVFTNISILGKDKFRPFISMSAGERRQHGEEMLSLHVFAAMKDLNKIEVTKLQKQEVELRFKQSDVEAKILRNQEKIDLHRQLGLNQILDLEDRVATAKAEYDAQDGIIKQSDSECIALQRQLALVQIKDLEDRVATAKAEYDAQDDIIIREADSGVALSYEMKDLEKKRDARSRVSIILNQKKYQLTALKKPEESSNCPTCGSPMTNEHYTVAIKEYEQSQAEIQEQIQKAEEILEKTPSVDADISELQIRINNCRVIIGTAEGVRSQSSAAMTQAEKEISRIKSSKCFEADSDFVITGLEGMSVTALQSRINDCKITVGTAEGLRKQAHSTVFAATREIERIKNSSCVEFEKELQEASSEKILIEAEYAATSKELIDRKWVDIALKDDGIKARVVENYLPFLNTEINRILQALNLFITVELTPEFDVISPSNQARGLSLESLSSGQQSRVDLAILLAWRSLSTRISNSHTNLLVMDEILESLSQTGISDFMTMWGTLDESEYTCLAVVSQRLEEFEPLFDRTVVYALVDDVTRVL